MKEVNVSLKEMKQMEKEEKKTKVTNIYKGISTEERIRIYLKICGFIYEQAEER